MSLLRRHIDIDVAGNAPWFATYEKIKGELDFYVRSLTDHKNYGIEVKAGSNSGNTVTHLLKDGKIDYIYYFKGDTYGGKTEDGRTCTIPLYLAPMVKKPVVRILLDKLVLQCYTVSVSTSVN